MPPVLGYYKLRGRAQPIRNLLAYVGEDYVDKYYELGESMADYPKCEWFKDKFNLGLDFPNNPYYIDGDLKLSQTFAILRHLGRKHNLDGKTEKEHCQLDIMQGALSDLCEPYFRMNYEPNDDEFEKQKTMYLDDLQVKLKQWSTFLGDKNWLLGDRITFIDFPVYEHFYWMTQVFPGSLDKYPTLLAYIKRFESQEKIAKYMASDKFIDRPFQATFARLGK